MSARILIVDDEAPARARLRTHIEDGQLGEVIGEAANGEDALRLAGALTPDVVLLDVRMPGMNGLEAARHMALLPAPPAIVFTTAYDAYAVEAFEAEAVGYLLKPVRAERLATALERAARLASPALDRLARRERQPAARTHIGVRRRDGVHLVSLADVLYFSADQKYTTLRHTGGSELIEDSLRALEEEFGARFVRVHRNALVQRHCIAGLERDVAGQYQVVLRGAPERLQVSRRLVSELREQLRI
ncbi:MAG: response regulator transcription factor [Gammaproteobacteria bacterium]|nr:response regulator transcription factor [Gammaproteobacteria bacterium]